MMEFVRVIELSVRPPEVWTALWDAQELGRCIPGCQDVQEVEPQRRYQATVRERVGPYQVEIPIEVLVDPLDEGTRLAVKASGRDSVLSSPVKVSMIVALAPRGTGTSLTLRGKADLGGKLAALGQAVIQRKTRDLLSEFAANLGRLLTGRSGTTVV
jgi:carbon monoxide dehydrogenase subunit G